MERQRIYDNHGRQINYLRLAVTDRCNLRCFYCMPENGIEYVPREQLLTYEEMLRVITVVASFGVTKIRITGGEPFVRKGMMDFIERVSTVDGIDFVHLTTNGTLTRQYISRLQEAGVNSVNLSLDSLNCERFEQITRRNCFNEVMATLEAMLSAGMRVKLNTVVMAGRNIEDILPFIEFTRNRQISVRFIEEMPFNGSGVHDDHGRWDHIRILQHIQGKYLHIEKLTDPEFSTSRNYRIPGYAGEFGIIAAYSRTFCGTCNRLRITPQGQLKTCLYDGGVFNVRDLMRAGASDEQLRTAFIEAIGHRARDGWEAQRTIRNSPIQESMSTIGG